MNIDISRDGPTEEKVKLYCEYCKGLMASTVYLVCGKRMWAKLHDVCADAWQREHGGQAGHLEGDKQIVRSPDGPTMSRSEAYRMRNQPDW